MDRKRKMLRLLVLLLSAFLAMAAIALSGCPTTGQAAKSAPDEVGSAAVDEATEAAKEETRKAIRDGIDIIFGR